MLIDKNEAFFDKKEIILSIFTNMTVTFPNFKVKVIPVFAITNILW